MARWLKCSQCPNLTRVKNNQSYKAFLCPRHRPKKGLVMVAKDRIKKWVQSRPKKTSG